MKKAKDMRDRSLDELEAEVRDARRELFELRNQRGTTKKLDQPHLMQHKRKEIARLLTVKREKQMQS